MQAFEKFERMVFPRTGVERVLQIFLRNSGDPVEVTVIYLAKIVRSKLRKFQLSSKMKTSGSICSGSGLSTSATTEVVAFE